MSSAVDVIDALRVKTYTFENSNESSHQDIHCLHFRSRVFIDVPTCYNGCFQIKQMEQRTSEKEVPESADANSVLLRYA